MSFKVHRLENRDRRQLEQFDDNQFMYCMLYLDVNIFNRKPNKVAYCVCLCIPTRLHEKQIAISFQRSAKKEKGEEKARESKTIEIYSMLKGNSRFNEHCTYLFNIQIYVNHIVFVDETG